MVIKNRYSPNSELHNHDRKCISICYWKEKYGCKATITKGAVQAECWGRCSKRTMGWGVCARRSE